MVTLKEYEGYLKVKRSINGHEGSGGPGAKPREAEIISRLMDDNKYVPLIIKSDDADPIKYYSTSEAATHCGVTKQTLDYAHRNRCMRIGEKEELKNLDSLGYRYNKLQSIDISSPLFPQAI